MEPITAPVTALLRRCGMYPGDIDLTTMANLFLGQMRISFYGGASSIPIIPTDITTMGDLPNGLPVAVALVDDQSIQTGLVRFRAGICDFEPGDSFPVPGAEYPAPLEDLIFAVAELLSPLLDKSDQIALCLDFPLRKLADGDFSIDALKPGFQLDGWAEKPLAKSLITELQSRDITGKQVLALPAIAATLLDGVAEKGAKGRYLGLHWGRGVNCSFVAPKGAVVKLKTGDNTLTIFDTGSGGFTGVPFGTPDLTMDRDSQYPGVGLLDKMVSTEHLGNIYRFTVLKAIEADLLTFMCGREFLSLRSLDLSAVLRFMDEPEGDNLIAEFCAHDEKDRAVALSVAHSVLDRAAKLVAANLTATLTLVGAGRDPQAPAHVSLSGEAFSSPHLRGKFEQHLRSGTEEALGFHLDFQKADHAQFPGAAAAVLLNQNQLIK